MQVNDLIIKNGKQTDENVYTTLNNSTVMKIDMKRHKTAEPDTLTVANTPVHYLT